MENICEPKSVLRKDDKVAKGLLWFMVIIGFIAGYLSYSSGGDVEMFTRITVISSLGILALCESIEKSKG